MRSMRSTASSPIVSVGELLWDLLPAGRRLGGTTANFAILSARLGDFAWLISCVGRDEPGDAAMRALQGVAHSEELEGHFDIDAVQWSDDLPTGTVGVTLDEHKVPRYTIHEPVAWDRITLSEALISLAGAASAICYGTLAQREETSRRTIRAMVEASRPECVRVCDVNLREPFFNDETITWSIQNAAVLKVSCEELPAVARMLGDVSICTDEILHAGEPRQTAIAESAAARLLKAAPACELVAITLGARGSLLATRRETDRHAGFPVTVADTIGAGDAFTAGLVHAFVRGASLRQISTVSNLCGSYVASQPGATPAIPAALLASIQEALTGQDVLAG